MIALDTSSFVAYLSGEKGDDVDAVDMALKHQHGFLPPVVLSELLSDSKLPKNVVDLIKGLPSLPLSDGYWERVGLLRSKVIAKGQKAKLADALIAQTCIDHDVPLVTRDRDFRHFVQQGGLKLLF